MFKAQTTNGEIHIVDCADKEWTITYEEAADIYDELQESDLWSEGDHIILIHNNCALTLSREFHEYAKAQIYCALMAIYWDDRMADQGEVLDLQAKAPRI